MYKDKNTVVKNIEQLIDMSCNAGMEDGWFKLFHLTIIKMAYGATEVSIDYNRKRVYMNAMVDDGYYDYYDSKTLLPTIAINLVYNDLRNFLYTCVLKDDNSLRIYPSIMANFLNRKYVSVGKKVLNTV